MVGIGSEKFRYQSMTSNILLNYAYEGWVRGTHRSTLSPSSHSLQMKVEVLFTKMFIGMHRLALFPINDRVLALILPNL